MTKGELLTRLFLFGARAFYRLRVRGIENLPEEGACVITFNHVAPIVDGTIGLVVMQRRPDAVPFGGHALSVDSPLRRLMARFRSSDGTGMLRAYKARGLSAGELLKALTLLDEGRPITLAAEGELTWDGQLQYPLAPGAAWMALRACVPVVAVVSKGGYDIMPRWGGLPKPTGHLSIRVGRPFYVSDEPAKRVDHEMVAAASQRIYDEMTALLSPS
jgi:1-acyl-sn-glycerol-3-phosphate acyltransferase